MFLSHRHSVRFISALVPHSDLFPVREKHFRGVLSSISHTSVLIFRHWLFKVFECTVREKHCLLIVACWYAFISARYLDVSAWVSCSSDPVNITKPLEATTCFSAMTGFLPYPLSRWWLLPAHASYHTEPVVTTAVCYNTIIIANFKWYLQLTELNRGNKEILFIEIIQTN